MPTHLACNVLGFLWNNINQGLDSIEDARRYVAKRLKKDLTLEERVFLEVALYDHHQLKEFHDRFCAPAYRPSRRKKRSPILPESRALRDNGTPRPLVRRGPEAARRAR